jgi:arylsulfatase A-like enzyme
LTQPDTPVVRKDWAEYLDAIQIADRNVGAGLRALRESGQEDNTYVIFMGDHGPCFQRGKMALYDFGLRVPLAIRGPNVQKGIRSEALVSSVDLMPTILQWAGIQPPSRQDGSGNGQGEAPAEPGSGPVDAPPGRARRKRERGGRGGRGSCRAA